MVSAGPGTVLPPIQFWLIAYTPKPAAPRLAETKRASERLDNVKPLVTCSFGVPESAFTSNSSGISRALL